MNQSLVSIIIPTHNRPELLLRAVKSVINQTYQNIEIIIVDDVGNVPEELKTLSNKIKYLHIPNTLWVSENRNAGIKISNGKYIAGLDDDDYWFNNYLDTLIPIMEADETIGFACSNGYQTNDLHENPTKLMFPHLQNEMQGNLFIKMIWDCFTQPSMMIIRKTMFDRLGLYKNMSGEDLDLIMRVTAFTNSYYSPKPCVVWYRQIYTNDSASVKSQSTLENRIKILIPMIQCLTEIQNIAHLQGRKFSLSEKLAIYFQIYFYHCYIIAVHFIFKSPERYNELKKEIIKYPLLTPITLLTPLCSNKFVRDLGQEIKKRLI